MSKKQKALNDRAISVLQELEASGAVPTPAQLDDLQQYAGRGGLGEKGRGLLYEFYTPRPIVAAMWAMAQRNGFEGGSILEPSVGTGRFLQYVDPATCSVDAFEYSDVGETTSFRIARACFPWANITNGAFETIFYTGNKRTGTSKRYDLVIGNPPYGDRDGYWQAPKLEGKQGNATRYEHYFIEKGIELLNPGGLLVFIVPSTFMDGPQYAKFRAHIETMAELVEAYRLPLNAFDFTAIQTDIIVFKRL